MWGSPHFPQNVFNIAYGQLDHGLGSNPTHHRLFFRDTDSSGGRGKQKLSGDDGNISGIEPLLISPPRSDHLDSNRQLDLFTTRLAKQLLIYVSPCLDPQAFDTDSLSLDWDILPFPDFFPPSPILTMVLQNVKQSSNTFLVIAPLWPHQSWYPDLISLSVDHPLCLPQLEVLLVQELLRNYWIHPNPGLFQYHAWLLSGSTSK